MCFAESPCELRVDLRYEGKHSSDPSRKNMNNTYYAQYGYFDISDENDYFRIAVSSYLGNAGDEMKDVNGRRFLQKTMIRTNLMLTVKSKRKVHGGIGVVKAISMGRGDFVMINPVCSGMV